MTLKSYLLGAALVSAGLTIGFISANILGGENSSGSDSAERRVLYWQAPMDPSFRSDSPGKSPMGMDLIPVYEGEEADPDGAILISPAVENNIGVRTAQVARADFFHAVSSVGYVRPDEDQTSVVDVRAEGWIEDLPVAAVGDVVSAGDLLFRMYSPEIATAQAEYIQARRIGRDVLISAAQSRLVALGVTRDQINRIARTGNADELVEVRASQDGVVIALEVREGSYVRPGAQLMTISDLSSVWILVDVFEDDALMVSPGQDVHIRSTADPSRTWHGVVEYVYPTVDPQSRSVPVRIRSANEDGALRPETYVNVTIDTEPHVQALTIPREAVIRSGQSDRVIVAEGEGRYRPARIETGMESDGRIEILSGLLEGERIVVSSQFLIDSEASLQGAALRMSPPGAIDEAEGTQVQQAEGRGVIVSLMAGHGMIDLEHEPIEALGWPAMSMSFLTLDGVDLSEFAVGQSVMFDLQRNEDGEWRISAIMAQDMDVPTATDEPGHGDHAGHGGH